MNKQNLTWNATKFSVLLCLLFSSACIKKTEKQQSFQQQTETPTKRNCEVETKSQVLVNKLLASAENIRSTNTKLHEIVEKHDHHEMTEKAERIEDDIITLMKESTYLPLANFYAIHQKAAHVYKIVSQFAWENRYYGFEPNAQRFEEIESSCNALRSDIRTMNDLPEIICETMIQVSHKDIHNYISLYGYLR